MPRKSRMYRPGIPAHIAQRGHNRKACFFAEENYCRYKEALHEGLRCYGGALHAYCLMTNHVHLLITPAEEDSISRIIQHTGREYVSYINKTYQRSGTLWEGRHKGSMVEAETYLLTCYRYIELNPVAAYMVESPEQYVWSSYHHNGLGAQDQLITEHPIYRQYGKTAAQRTVRYRELFQRTARQEDIAELRGCLAANQVLGSESFRKSISAIFDRPLGWIQPGRPRHTHDDKSF